MLSYFMPQLLCVYVHVFAVWTLSFLEQFWIHSKIKNVQQSGIFITTDGLTLAHDRCPELVVDDRVPSCCCTFCGFEQMYGDKYSPLQYHPE